MTYVQQLLDKIKELKYGSLALVVGRYYAMDRDKRFERNKIAYEGMVQGIGEVASPDTIIDVWKSTVHILNFNKIFLHFEAYSIELFTQKALILHKHFLFFTLLVCIQLK